MTDDELKDRLTVREIVETGRYIVTRASGIAFGRFGTKTAG